MPVLTVEKMFPMTEPIKINTAMLINGTRNSNIGANVADTALPVENPCTTFNMRISKRTWSIKLPIATMELMKIPTLGIKAAIVKIDESRPKGTIYNEVKYACDVNDPLPPKIKQLKYVTPTLR